MAVNAARNETQLSYHRRRAEDLKSTRNPWEAEWRALAEYIEPTRLRLQLRDERSTGRKSIIDSTGTFALRTLQSGMHSGITSPARPWFRLTTFDPDLKDFAPVKMYLDAVERRMREVFQGSNIYNAFHMGYGDLGQFGQSVAILAEDDTDTIRMQPLMHGTFWLARDEKGRATTLYRRFRWTVQRIVGRFGYSNCSQTIRSAYDGARYDERYDIWHAIEPRLNRDHSKIAADGSTPKSNKAFLSNYWEDGATDNKLLEESGFDENPIIAPAWEIAGDDHYGVSPGMIALADVKMLQKEQTRKLEAIDKMVRPPMTGPTSMRNNPASLLPGAITYVDDPTGKGYRPAVEVNVNLSYLREDINETRDRIRQAFYADLFLMLSNMEGIQPRNTFEIAERKEEKLLALGPVLENIYNGQLAPVIDRTFAILDKRGELPPAPAELEGQELKVEYISMLAQAQKAVATGAIERGFAFAAQVAAVKPEVLDKVNADEAVDQYFDALGVPPALVVSDEDVEKVRAARAQQQQQAQQAEMMAQVAPAVKDIAAGAEIASGAMNNPSPLAQLGLG